MIVDDTVAYEPMFADLFIPIGTMLHLTAASITADQVTVQLTTTAPTMACPTCQTAATRVHSRYHRTMADLPMLQRPVEIALHVRRFFCDNSRCPRHTFCERLPDLVAVQARRTTRLQREQQRLAIDIGGEAGARLAFRQGMPVSPATLLRFARRTPLPSRRTPRVLGVDDFSLRKGQVFGTILVDLERHQPIDLLPDRSSDTLADWLTTHPGVEVISRDRSPAYADGATRGAPMAVQVADRFHLLQNLRDAVQRVLEQHLAVIIEVQTPPAVVTSIAPPEPPDQSALLANAVMSPPTASQSPSVVRTRREQRQAEGRARRHARFAQVRALHQEGQGIRAIAKQLGISRQTVRCFVRADQFPEQGQRLVQRRTLDPFLPYLREQLVQGNDNGV